MVWCLGAPPLLPLRSFWARQHPHWGQQVHPKQEQAKGTSSVQGKAAFKTTQQAWACAWIQAMSSHEQVQPTQPQGQRQGAPTLQQNSKPTQRTAPLPLQPQQSQVGRQVQLAQPTAQHKISSSSLTALSSPQHTIVLRIVIDESRFLLRYFMRVFHGTRGLDAGETSELPIQVGVPFPRQIYIRVIRANLHRVGSN